jgi:rhomboid protease GluP
MPLILKSSYLTKTHYKHGIGVTLSILFLMFFFSKLYWQGWLGADEYFAANKFLVFEKHEHWRLFTSLFVHSDLKHFLSNAYMMFFLSYLNYSYFGPWLFPILSIFFAALVNLISLYTYPETVFLVGASGWVYLLGGSWLSLFILIDKSSSYFLRIFKSIAVALIIFFPQSYLPEVSYRAHAIGFVTGILTGIIFYIFRKNEIASHELWEDDSDDEFLDDPPDVEITEEDDSPTFH